METIPSRAIKVGAPSGRRAKETATTRESRDGFRVRGRRQARRTLQDFLKSFNL